jgi:YVTN family beta-propeller protein
VSAINAKTDTVTATIPVGHSPAGVAVNPTTGILYVTNGLDNTVSVIDAAGRKLVVTLTVGTEPIGVAVNSTTDTAYVGNYAGGTVSVISAARTPTALTASIRVSPQQDLVLTATLTAAGLPLSGQSVSFTTGATHLCTVHTSTTGVATCTLTAAQTLKAEQHGTIQANFTGTAIYQPSKASATTPK